MVSYLVFSLQSSSSGLSSPEFWTGGMKAASDWEMPSRSLTALSLNGSRKLYFSPAMRSEAGAVDEGFDGEVNAAGG